MNLRNVARCGTLTLVIAVEVLSMFADAHARDPKMLFAETTVT